MACAAFLLALLGVAVAGPAAAGAFRCNEPSGSVRFADSPHACPRGGVPLEGLRPRLKRLPTPPPAAPALDAPNAASVRDLSEVWLRAAEIGPGWDVVREAPVDPSEDPDLVAWGVRAQDARHYTRDANGSVQVCSVELWSFADVPRARAAHQGFSHPGWRIEREANLLLMLRGLTVRRGEPPRRGIFEDCTRIGDRIRKRAKAASSAAP